MADIQFITDLTIDPGSVNLFFIVIENKLNFFNYTQTVLCIKPVLH